MPRILAYEFDTGIVLIGHLVEHGLGTRKA